MRRFLLFIVLCCSTLLVKAQIQQVARDTISTTLCLGEFYLQNGFAVIAQEAGFHTYVETFSTEDGRDSVVLLQVTVIGEKKIHLGEDRLVCNSKDFPIRLDAGGDFSNYLWSTGETTRTIEVTAPGTYSVQGFYSNHCEATDEIDVVSHEIEAHITMEPTNFCDDFTTTLSIDSRDATDFKWSNGETTPEITVHQHGTYTVEISNEYCTATKDFTIEECPFMVFFPNAFTPYYRDGINDYFEMKGNKQAISKMVVIICDRWGNQVFYSEDIDFKWDGMVGDHYPINEVFGYAVKIFTFQGQRYVFKGTVTLL